MSDPGMIVLPTHRLFRGVPPLTRHELIGAAGDVLCSAASIGQGPERADTIWSEIEQRGRTGTRWDCSPPGPDLGRWPESQPTAKPACSRWPQTTAPIGRAWASVSCTAWSSKPCWNCRELPKPEYVHLVRRGRSTALQIHDPTARSTPLAALVMPATLDHIRIDQRARRADAGQEHLLLPQAAQRPGDQPAGVKQTCAAGPPQGKPAHVFLRSSCASAVQSSAPPSASLAPCQNRGFHVKPSSG